VNTGIANAAGETELELAESECATETLHLLSQPVQAEPLVSSLATGLDALTPANRA
jgi:hypothetical protein